MSDELKKVTGMALGERTSFAGPTPVYYHTRDITKRETSRGGESHTSGVIIQGSVFTRSPSIARP